MNFSDYLYYDETSPTGLRWKVDRSSKVKVGNVAGSIDRGRGGCSRYVRYQVRLYGKVYRAHRVLWEIVNGPIPEGLQIDHIDGDATNNKIENLRLVTSKENARNRRLARNNTSGTVGVRKMFVKGEPYWRAYWYDEEGNPRTISFSESKYGTDGARAMAERRRAEEIAKLAHYTERHGTIKQ